MKVQIFFLLVGMVVFPLYSQELPPLVPVPQADSASQLEAIFQEIPAVEEIKPIVVTQTLTQVQTLTQTVTNTVVATNTVSFSNKMSPPVVSKKSKEISLQEYKYAKKALYKKMRASESLFRRTGSWLDLSFISSTTYITGSQDRLELLGAYLSWGRITKGIMFGLSYQYTASDSSVALSLPSLHEGAIVLGYRIAPDKGIGVRFMFHTGLGSSFRSSAVGASFSTPLTYVFLMPEIKLDIRLYKSLVFTTGVAYKGKIFLSESSKFQNALANELGFNTFRGFRYSLGLAISY
ncbi:MAG: hypothetical protein ACRCY4_02795 [Brevinema sp.]